MFDVLTIAALTDEMAQRLLGGRIQKTLQLDDASIGLEIYVEGQRVFLIASADSRSPRLYLSSARLTADPDRVTPLLLLLRKYARGSQIVSVQQPPLERIIQVSIAKRFFSDNRGQHHDGDDDEPGTEGEIVYTNLYVELMGRRSNIILTDDAGKILDAIKRVTPEMSRVRPILPGRIYQPPPAQEKLDPRRLTRAAIAELLAGATPGTRLAELLVRGLTGFSPQMAAEVVYRAFGATDRVVDGGGRTPEAVDALLAATGAVLAPLDTGAWEPSVYLEEETPVAFGAIRLESFARVAVEERFGTISQAIERFVTATATTLPVRHAQRRAKLTGEIQEAVNRAAARLRSMEEERQRAEAAERWREMGETIYAYLYQIEPGQAALDVDGLTIPLDPALTASENAQAYFERYRKAQSASRNLPELLDQARTDLAYLKELRTLAEFAEGIEEIEQARHEWEEWNRPGGANVPSPSGKKPRRVAPKRPVPIRSREGDLIYVGHNGRQNDLITFDLAGPDDTWLHARGMPGAHVIVHWVGEENAAVLEHAAQIAAWYSAGRGATRVEVDATKRRYVRKIKGAGPGMVTYREERTLNVHPASPEQLGLAG